jgi:hypothetical protein
MGHARRTVGHRPVPSMAVQEKAKSHQLNRTLITLRYCPKRALSSTDKEANSSCPDSSIEPRL